jgi:hypothetical protein
MTAVRTEPIIDASAWVENDLMQDKSWEHTLSDNHLADLDNALKNVRKLEFQLAEITSDTFPLPALEPMLSKIQDELKAGRGFALMHGFPVNDYNLEDQVMLYWGLCTHLGIGITQNSQADLVQYVTDGRLQPQQGARKVGSPRAATLHNDLTDCVSLLSVRQPPDSPLSYVASSTTLYNEILRQHPEYLPLLYNGFIWDRQDEEADGETPTSNYAVPFFSEEEGIISCRYNRSWIRKGFERRGQEFTPEETEILDFIDQMTFENRFEFQFPAGDIQFCNNYLVMHGRAAHEPVEDESRKRLLLRIWLDLPNVRPFTDESIIRYGVVRHGQLGWTAADLLSGHNHHPRQRRNDGASLIEN